MFTSMISSFPRFGKEAIPNDIIIIADFQAFPKSMYAKQISNDVINL